MAKRRHKKKRPMPVVRVGEMATPERRRQQGGVMTEVLDRDSTGNAIMKRHRARIECMLDYYFNEFRINNPQYMAGMKFREIYLRVNYGYSCKILCNPFLMDSGRGYPEGKMLAHIDCMRYLNEAYQLLSPEQASVMRDVCGMDEYPGNKDRKATLLRALDKLAAHWGYV
jgi:hypothetical protein